jgi:hypothetical protein
MTKISKIEMEARKSAPVILIMDEDMKYHFTKVSENKRGSVTTLFGADCDETT